MNKQVNNKPKEDISHGNNPGKPKNTASQRGTRGTLPSGRPDSPKPKSAQGAAGKDRSGRDRTDSSARNSNSNIQLGNKPQSTSDSKNRQASGNGSRTGGTVGGSSTGSVPNNSNIGSTVNRRDQHCDTGLTSKGSKQSLGKQPLLIPEYLNNTRKVLACDVATLTRETEEYNGKHKSANLRFDGKKFTEANFNSYSLVISLWAVTLIDVCGPDVRVPFTEYVNRKGLIGAIREGDDFCSRLLAHYGEKDYTNDNEPIFWRFVYSAVANKLFSDFAGGDVPEAIFLREMLKATRFAKRFSPDANPLTHYSTLEKFKSREQSNASHNTSGKDMYYSPHLTWRIKQIISEICHDVRLDISEGYYSTGSQVVGFDVTRTLNGNTVTEKYKWRTSSCKAKKVLMNPTVTYDDARLEDIKSESIVVIKAVNKNLSTARIIGQECADRAFCAQALNVALRRSAETSEFGKCFHFDDQSPNATACAKASIDGLIASIDQTSASDTITWSMAASWFPNTVANYMRAVRPKYVVYDGTTKARMEMAFSSGHALTATVQTIVFFAIDLAVTELVAYFLDKEVVPEEEIIVYNDDQLVPSYAAEAIRDAHKTFGLITNMEKSYWNGRYREACGEEMLDGISVSHTYFPRKTFDWSNLPETYSALVELQGKMNPSAARYLARVLECIVKYAGKEPTYSYSGFDIRSEYNDNVRRINPKRRGLKFNVCISIPTSKVYGDSILTRCASDLADYLTYIQGADSWKDISWWERDTFEGDFELYLKWALSYKERTEFKRLFSEAKKKALISLAVGNKTESYTPSTYHEVICGCDYKRTMRYHEFSFHLLDWSKYGEDSSFSGITHLSAEGKSEPDYKPSDTEEYELDMFRYRSFLREGPRYESDLMRSLGISQKPVTNKDLCSKTTMKWTWIEDR